MSEKDLFCAVIAQAFKDATSKQFDGDSQERKRERNNARSWLIGDSAAFRFVCDCAGMNAQAMRAKAIELEGIGWKPLRELANAA